jgi:hypothetical protein
MFRGDIAIRAYARRGAAAVLIEDNHSGFEPCDSRGMAQTLSDPDRRCPRILFAAHYYRRVSRRKPSGVDGGRPATNAFTRVSASFAPDFFT